MHHTPIDTVLVLLALAVAVVALARRAQLPTILGYLAVGFAAGPHALGWIGDDPLVRLLGEIGVAFLLFGIGLEFSLERLVAMRGTLFGLGSAQVLISTATGAFILALAGASWSGAFVLGAAMALSSTAIVTRQLADQLELQSRHGHLALGILLFQDLAVVPLLAILPSLADAGGTPLGPELALALAKGLFALAGMLAIGRYLLRPLLHHIALTRSAELFTLTVLLIGLASAWFTASLGLSLALGAFLAGMMLAETEFRHQIETDIRPFRDILLGLFFVAVGMALDPRAVLADAPWIALLVVGLVIGKGGVIAFLVRFAGHESGVAFRTGAVLAQAGEFGFAILAVAIALGLLDIAAAQPAIAAMVISMAIAPLLIRHNGTLAKHLFAKSYLGEREHRARRLEEAARGLAGHVVLAGFGRMGQCLGRVLREAGQSYVALDLDPGRVHQAFAAGDRVFYGDATHHQILHAAGLAQAAALVVTLDDTRGAERVLREARRLRPDLPIVVRARDDATLERLLAAGATEVVPEAIEAALTLATRLLERLDLPGEDIRLSVEVARAEKYRDLTR